MKRTNKKNKDNSLFGIRLNNPVANYNRRMDQAGIVPFFSKNKKNGKRGLKATPPVLNFRKQIQNNPLLNPPKKRQGNIINMFGNKPMGKSLFNMKPVKARPLFNIGTGKSKRKPLFDMKQTRTTIPKMLAGNGRQAAMFPIFDPPKPRKLARHKINMDYPQARQRYGIHPVKDDDRDGVFNWADCKPFDPTRHMPDDQRRAMFAEMQKKGTYDPRKDPTSNLRATGKASKEDRKWLVWISKKKAGLSPYEKAQGATPDIVKKAQIRAGKSAARKELMGTFEEAISNLHGKVIIKQKMNAYGTLTKCEPIEAEDDLSDRAKKQFLKEGKKVPPADSYEFKREMAIQMAVIEETNKPKNIAVNKSIAATVEKLVRLGKKVEAKKLYDIYDIKAREKIRKNLALTFRKSEDDLERWYIGEAGGSPYIPTEEDPFIFSSDLDRLNVAKDSIAEMEKHLANIRTDTVAVLTKKGKAGITSQSDWEKATKQRVKDEKRRINLLNIEHQRLVAEEKKRDREKNKDVEKLNPFGLAPPVMVKESPAARSKRKAREDKARQEEKRSKKKRRAQGFAELDGSVRYNFRIFD